MADVDSNQKKMQTVYKIRMAEPRDLDELAHVERVCFPAVEAASKASLKERTAVFPESFFVAEAEGKIIGFINGCATDECRIRDEMFENSGLHKADGAYQSVFGLDVLPEYRKMGIAAALMNHLIADAKTRGRSGLFLTCKDRLTAYYSKFGYKNMGISDSTHGNAVWYDMILEFSEEMR